MSRRPFCWSRRPRGGLSGKRGQPVWRKAWSLAIAPRWIRLSRSPQTKHTEPGGGNLDGDSCAATTAMVRGFVFVGGEGAGLFLRSATARIHRGLPVVRGPARGVDGLAAAAGPGGQQIG